MIFERRAMLDLAETYGRLGGEARNAALMLAAVARADSRGIAPFAPGELRDVLHVVSDREVARRIKAGVRAGYLLPRSTPDRLLVPLTLIQQPAAAKEVVGWFTWAH